MMTLDEVITSFELCIGLEGCSDCPAYMKPEGYCTRNDDALAYLKEYRNLSIALNPKIKDHRNEIN